MSRRSRNARKAGLVLSAIAAGALQAGTGVKLPATVDFELANGMKVFLVPNREVPLVSFAIRVAGGSVEDPPGKEGATQVLAELLRKGAGKRDAVAFLDAVEFVGGSLSTAANRRWISLEAEFLTEHAELGLELISDALRRPRLDAGEFDKERGLAIDAVREGREQPNRVLSTYALAWLYAGHPYARPPGGDERSLARLTVEDMRAQAERQLGPGRTWMVVAGDLDPAAMRKRIEARFRDWKGGAGPATRPARPAAAPAGVLVVDKPDALQTYFRFGSTGSDWSDPRYPARMLANTILGGRFTSRLNTALRIERGLTYGASSSFDDRLAGTFSVATYTQTSTSREAIELAHEVYEKFRAEGISQEELDSARTYIQGQYAPDNLETAAQVAGMVLSLAFDGLDRGIVDRLYQELDALTLEGVNGKIKELFPAGGLSWVMIGKASELRPLASRFGPVSEAPLAGPGFGPGFP